MRLWLIVMTSMWMHEMAHAAVALHQGDDTAKRLGRLSWNPLTHVSLVRTLLLPCVLLLCGLPPVGGMKPLPVDERKLRHGAKSDLAVSSAGIVANLLIAAVAYPLAHDVFVINICLAAFNMLPLPTFDGWRISRLLRDL